MFGKDAVYALRSRVQIEGNEIIGTFKDGLDLDGGTGQVVGNRFVRCGDEGIDLSLNQAINVHGNTILDARGGRVAADVGLEQIRQANTLGHVADE
jgi:hypothetical protein